MLLPINWRVGNRRIKKRLIWAQDRLLGVWCKIGGSLEHGLVLGVRALHSGSQLESISPTTRIIGGILHDSTITQAERDSAKAVNTCTQNTLWPSITRHGLILDVQYTKVSLWGQVKSAFC